MVSGRKYLDFISYCPGMPIFIKRVEPDLEYIKNLKEQLDIFETELSQVVSVLKSKF